MNMCGSVLMENLWAQRGLKLGYTTHPNTQRSIRFGVVLKNLSYGESLLSIPVEVDYTKK